MSETLQEKNKALLIKGFNTLFNDHNFAEAETLWSSNYIQHSGHIPPGREGLFTLVKAFPDGTKRNRFKRPQQQRKWPGIGIWLQQAR